MTDLEATRLCADAMGLRLLPALTPGEILYRPGHSYNGLMCSDGALFIQCGAYDPLHDDAQCMALIKRFRLDCVWAYDSENWCAFQDQGEFMGSGDEDLNRAVVLAIAQMQQAKEPLAQDAPGR